MANQQKEQDNYSPQRDSEYWVFGYGSLIWKPPPVYEERISGFIKGHVRRFWQKTTEHRGTVKNPGRVVTLIPHAEWKLMDDYHYHAEDDVTWGVAYRIADKDVEDVKEYLDVREKDYTCHFIDVYQDGRDEPVVKNAVVYIATTESESYAGPAPLEAIAQQIYYSHGRSGPNRDYLLNLAYALRIIAPHSVDQHLFDLEKRVLKLCELYGGETPAAKYKNTASSETTTAINQFTSSKNASGSLPTRAGIMEPTSFSEASISRRSTTNSIESLSSSNVVSLKMGDGKWTQQLSPSIRLTSKL